jgi:hypothetical protein
MRKLMVVALGVALVATGLTIGGGTAVAASCTGTVQVTSFGFAPPAVSPGQFSSANLVAQNCTNGPVQGLTTWAGRFLGSTAGIPPGCLAIDPVAQLANFGPQAQLAQSLRYLVPASCTASSLQVTVRVTGTGGVLLAQATADLAIVVAEPGCRVTYVNQSVWTGGFVANITIANIGTAAVNGWVLVFTYPGDQHVVNGWNGIVSQTGQTVTIRNQSYNALIAVGGSVSVGVQGTWQTSNAPPTSFTLNGQLCLTG